MKGRTKKKLEADSDYVSEWRHSCHHCVHLKILEPFCLHYQEQIPEDFIKKADNQCEFFEDDLEGA